jgi:hypothetical protein
MLSFDVILIRFFAQKVVQLLRRGELNFGQPAWMCVHEFDADQSMDLVLSEMS